MTSPIMVRLGKRIRELRREKKWRLIDLSEHCGVKEVHLSYVERGRKEVCINTLVAIAKGLEVRLSTLIQEVEHDEASESEVNPSS